MCGLLAPSLRFIRNIAAEPKNLVVGVFVCPMTEHLGRGSFAEVFRGFSTTDV